VADALKGLAGAGHHLTVLQIMDPAEREVRAEFAPLVASGLVSSLDRSTRS